MKQPAKLKIYSVISVLIFSFVSGVYAADNAKDSSGSDDSSKLPSEPELEKREIDVVKGDTLWELSQKYLSDPYLWPKLWSMNPQLSNPHQIEIGDKIFLLIPKVKVADTSNLRAEMVTLRSEPKEIEWVKLIDPNKQYNGGFLKQVESRAVGNLPSRVRSEEDLSSKGFHIDHYLLDTEKLKFSVVRNEKEDKDIFVSGDEIVVAEDGDQTKLAAGEYAVVRMLKEIGNKGVYRELGYLKAEKENAILSSVNTEVKEGDLLILTSDLKKPSIALTKTKVKTNLTVSADEQMDKLIFNSGDFLILEKENGAAPAIGNQGFLKSEDGKDLATLIILDYDSDDLFLAMLIDARREVKISDSFSFNPSK